MTLREYQVAVRDLFLAASADMAKALIEMPPQNDDNYTEKSRRSTAHMEYVKLRKLVESFQEILEGMGQV